MNRYPSLKKDVDSQMRHSKASSPLSFTTKV
jgi:hypothetical protein